MKTRSWLQNWAEYLPAFLLLKGLGLLPRRWALGVGHVIGRLTYWCWGRLRRVGRQNLQRVFPDLSPIQREQILNRAFGNLGRLLAEFSQFPRLNPSNIADIVEYDGLENFRRAAAQERGVLILTAHFGAWELSSFAHALYGHPMHFLVRRLDNPLLDGLLDHYRRLSGNQPIDKTQAARQVLRVLRRGGTVGVLMDLNTQPHEGVFCDFFGHPAGTSPIIATFALRAGSPIVPGYLIWDEDRQKHTLRFDPPVEITTTGDPQQDMLINTTRVNRILEDMIRRHPDHWLWVHKRWHTKPEGYNDLPTASSD